MLGINKKTWIWLLALVSFSFGIAVYINAGYNLPGQMIFSGDSLLTQTLIKSIQENGLLGVIYNPRLGAPENSLLADVPFLDWLMVIQVNFLMLFVKDSAAIMVIFLELTYVTTSVTMFFLLRRLHCNHEISFVFSILFSFSTYHTYRALGHVTLSNYFMVPLAVFLALYIASNGTKYEIMMPFKGSREMSCLALGTSVFLGFTNIYYVAFALIIIVIALVYRLFKTMDLKRTIVYLKYPIITLICVLISLLPKVIYSIVYGKNTVAGVRVPAEAEIYGLKIIQLILPSTFSRLGNLSGITEEYINNNPYISENLMASLGLIAAVGFLSLGAYFCLTFIWKKENFIYDFSALCVLGCVLFATVGGFGALFNLLVIPVIRSYNRISIFIICFCLLFLAVVINRLCVRPFLKKCLLGLMLIIAAFDQIMVYPETYWDGAANTAKLYSDFYKQVENNLDKGSMVYQLPFIEFPETVSLENMSCYDQLSAYVLTDNLKWSHGGVKGRNEQAKQLYYDKGIGVKFLFGIMKSGFSGVCLDSQGYTLEDWKNVMGFYTKVMKLSPIVSKDDRLFFFDIRGCDITKGLDFNREMEISNISKVVVNILDYYGINSGILKEVDNAIYYRTGEAAHLIYSNMRNSIFELNTENFIEECYRGILGREADEEGKRGKIREIENGSSKEKIIEEIIDSDEFFNKCGLSKEETILDFVIQFGWKNNLPKNKVKELIDSINDDANMAECLDNYLDNKYELDDEAYIDLLYRELLNREADKKGKTEKVSALFHGTNRILIIKEIINSEEFLQKYGRY